MNRMLEARLARLEGAESDPQMAELERMTDEELRALIVASCERRLADPAIDEQERADLLAELADEESAIRREEKAHWARYCAEGGPWEGYAEEFADLCRRSNAAAAEGRARRHREQERIRLAEQAERRR